MTVGVARWRGWAGALRARYSRASRRLSPAPMTLALERPPATTLLQPVCVRVSFSSRHTHHSRAAIPGPAGAREIVRETQPVARQTIRELPVVPAFSRSTHTVTTAHEDHVRMSRFAEIVTERVSARHSQTTALLIRPILESRARLLVSSEAAGDSARRIVSRARREELATPPAPRTLVLPPAASRSAEERQPADGGRPSTVRHMPSPSAPPEQALPLDSIAQYVMQQLDRQLIAHRERMGRI